MKNSLLLSFSLVFIVLISQPSKTLEGVKNKSNQKNEIREKANEQNLEHKSNIDYGEYMRNLQGCIQRQWKPSHEGVLCGSVMTRFKVLSNGTLVLNSTNIISNTGSDEDKSAAENALQDASSKCIFPLPKGAPSQVIIEFKFTKTGAMCPNKLIK